MNKNKLVFFTNDVELTSIVNNKQSIKTGKLVSTFGIPKLLEIYSGHHFFCTFFVTTDYAKIFPESVREIVKYGHEIGSHGVTHSNNDAFDLLNLEKQIQKLDYAKKTLEDISGEDVISFRAPALRVNKYTPRALMETGFKIDSSVASQRFDFFFSFGSKEKIKWLMSPRKPYRCSSNSLAKPGQSAIMEFPLISYLYPYIGTTLRIAPKITKMFRTLLTLEAELFDHYPVFLIHPNELILEIKEKNELNRRSDNYLDYLLKEKIRTYLKSKNLGDIAVQLLQEELKCFTKRGFKGICLSEYYNSIIKEQI